MTLQQSKYCYCPSNIVTYTRTMIFSSSPLSLSSSSLAVIQVRDPALTLLLLCKSFAFAAILLGNNAQLLVFFFFAFLFFVVVIWSSDISQISLQNIQNVYAVAESLNAAFYEGHCVIFTITGSTSIKSFFFSVFLFFILIITQSSSYSRPLRFICKREPSKC